MKLPLQRFIVAAFVNRQCAQREHYRYQGKILVRTRVIHDRIHYTL